MANKLQYIWKCAKYEDKFCVITEFSEKKHNFRAYLRWSNFFRDSEYNVERTKSSYVYFRTVSRTVSSSQLRCSEKVQETLLGLKNPKNRKLFSMTFFSKDNAKTKRETFFTYDFWHKS